MTTPDPVQNEVPSALRNTFNDSVGPQIAEGLRNGMREVGLMAQESGSWLKDQFQQLDPQAQQWIQAIGGFIAGMVGVGVMQRMTGGGDGLVAGITKYVAAGATAIYASSLKLGADPATPDGATPPAADADASAEATAEAAIRQQNYGVPTGP